MGTARGCAMKRYKAMQESPSLTMDEIREVAEGFKADLQRKSNRFVRRHDTAGALAALESVEYVDQFVYTLQLRAGSQLDTLKRPARARTIHIPEFLGKKKGGK